MIEKGECKCSHGARRRMEEKGGDRGREVAMYLGQSLVTINKTIRFPWIPILTTPI